MKRGCFLVAVLALISLALSAPARAQMGMDIFKRPAITKVMHPVVGKGAVYEDTGKEAKPRTSEISVVGKDSVDGKEAFRCNCLSKSSRLQTSTSAAVPVPRRALYARSSDRNCNEASSRTMIIRS